MIAYASGPDPDWEQVSHALDAAIGALEDKDRLPMLLRFFGRKPMREVGQTLGISEDAAKMRVSRALDRLREIFKERGIACASVALGVWLLENGVQAAPSEVIKATHLAAARAVGHLGSSSSLTLNL